MQFSFQGHACSTDLNEPHLFTTTPVMPACLSHCILIIIIVSFFKLCCSVKKYCCISTLAMKVFLCLHSEHHVYLKGLFEAVNGTVMQPPKQTDVSSCQV